MNVLFVKEKDGSTTNDLLCRILNYLTSYTKKNKSMPDYVKLSEKDVQRIKDYNKTLIDDENRILGMKIITYQLNENKNYNNKRNFRNDKRRYK